MTTASLGHHRRAAWLITAALVTSIGSAREAGAKAISIEFRIHPKLAADQCTRLPTVANLAEEEDFPKVLSKGWAALRESSFDESRDYPCLQDVTVVFPSPQALHGFISQMSACPQYPFYSGADYELQTAVFEYAASSADATAYRRLLAKDGRCVSEMNPPLYAILRKNQQALLRAFASLGAEQQRVAAATQFDFNLSVEEQQFDVEHLQDSSSESEANALHFNQLLATEAKSR